MSKLSTEAVRMIDRAGVEIMYADRQVVKLWNDLRDPHEEPYFTGWYWHHEAIPSEFRPFRGAYKTKSACMRSVHAHLQRARTAQQQQSYRRPVGSPL